MTETRITPNEIANTAGFSVYRSAALSVGTAATKITFDTELFDMGNNFASGKFTASVDGYYFFSSNVITLVTGIGTDIQLLLYKNGSLLVTGPKHIASLGTTPGLSFASPLIQLVAGDYIEIYMTTASASKSLDVTSSANNTFSGFMVSQI